MKKPPGGGFNPYDATVVQIREWLRTDPGRLQATAVLQQEHDGKGRISAIVELEDYIEEAD